MKIVLVGKSASGKDYLMDQLESKGFNVAVKHTTRPRREKEIDGITYHYINNDKFNNFKNGGHMFCAQSFDVKGDEWQYGLTQQEVAECDVMMLTPRECLNITEDIRDNFTIVYLDIDIYVRYKRIYARMDKNDDILRRINNDEWDFRNFKDFDIHIKDEQFKVDEIIDLIYNKKDNRQNGISFMVNK